MALVKCKECGNEVSTKAKSCSKCGAKIKKPLRTFGTLAILLIGGLIIASVISQGQHAGTSSQSSSSGTSDAKLQKDLLAAMPKDNRWFVRIDKAGSRSVMASVIYNSSPLSLADVENDTKGVARKILEVLQANGHNPRDEWASVTVFAEKPTRGETGAALVIMYGATHYSYNNDQLVFKPAKE